MPPDRVERDRQQHCGNRDRQDARAARDDVGLEIAVALARGVGDEIARKNEEDRHGLVAELGPPGRGHADLEPPHMEDEHFGRGQQAHEIEVDRKPPVQRAPPLQPSVIHRTSKAPTPVRTDCVYRRVSR